MSMIKSRKKSREEIAYWQDLRRSNAAQPHKNKKKYSRKDKHKSLTFDRY
jgi:hypothetical protein